MPSKQDYSKNSLPEISSFSKHLMLLIIAVFAMLTPLLNSSDSLSVRLLLYSTILLVIASFYYGHLVLTSIIDVYTNPLNTSICIHDIQPIIKKIQKQLLISILSVLCLVATYGFHTWSDSHKINKVNNNILTRIISLENNISIIKSDQRRLVDVETKIDVVLGEFNKIKLECKIDRAQINLNASDKINFKKNKVYDKDITRVNKTPIE